MKRSLFLFLQAQITYNVHFQKFYGKINHTIEADDDKILDEIEREPDAKGFLLKTKRVSN